MKNQGLLDPSKRGKVELVELFLKHGAQVDWQDKEENTALFAAIENQHLALTKVLLGSGARLDLTKRDGRTVFELALRKHQDEIAHLIMDRYREFSEIPNTANVDLDLKLHRFDIHGALNLFESGCSVSLRAIKSACIPEEEPIVGNQNEYLKYLCSSINEIESSLGSGKMATAQDTSSNENFLCASRWLLNCLTKHVNCIVVEGLLPPLPTRIIDVGLPNDSVNIVLLVTEQIRGRYVALSHRWGDSDIKKTTRSNLGERLNGMLLSDLTKTMQEAVIITRRLGIRYLWIDAICIIQDSHSDWSYEASRMSDVYKNSVLTISAAASADHSHGCFASSDTHGSGGDLTSRGWILQEELLSPRTLEYGFGSLKWECITCISFSDQEEEEIDIGKESVPTEKARFKRALYGFRSTSMSLKNQAHTSWQHMVMSYSRRTLTNDSDKLMAIAGIAAFAEKTLEDVFLAGLWEQHLYRDLLWTSNCDAAARITSTHLPSWSWASIGGSISYTRRPAGSTPTYMKSMLELVSAKVEDGENGPICQKLVFTGSLLKVSRGKFANRHLLYSIPRDELVEEDGIEADKPETHHLPPQTPNKESSEGPHKLGWFWRTFGWGPRIALAEASSSSTEISDESSKNIPATPARITGTDLLQGNDEERDLHAEMQKRRKNCVQLWPDIKSEEFDEAWLFPVAMEYFWIHCLVLVPVDDVEEKGKGRRRNRRRFRRVGKCHVNNMNSREFFSKQEYMKFELV